MLKLTKTECPQNLTLCHIYHRGHWTNPYAETFGPTVEEPTHLHIYNRPLCTEAYKLGHLTLAPTIKTFSED